MAGGSLSPRQKMINLMYLVLTAFLALNVSATVLDSFQQIADSLGESAYALSNKNKDLAGDIRATIEGDESTDKNDWLLPKIDEVRKETKGIFDEIQMLIDTLYSDEIAGREEALETHLENKSETESNYRFFMIGEGGTDTDNNRRGSGKAKELKDKLDAYIDWANALSAELRASSDSTGNKIKPSDDYFGPIAKEPAEIYADAGNEFAEKRDQTWEFFNFHDMPAVSNLAFLQKLKNDVAVVEATLLQQIRERTSDIVFRIDSLILVSAPESRYVIGGLPFKTKLYVTVASSDVTPTFSSSSGSIENLDGGQAAELSVAADGGRIPENANQITQNYAVTARVPKADGSFETINYEGDFIVRRPEIQVTSAAIQQMYLACANDIKVDVPALGEYYNPQLKPRGGQIKQDPSNPKLVRCVPSSSQFVLQVSSLTNGQVIRVGQIQYRVIPPPKPTLELFAQNQPWLASQKVNPKSTITVRVTPDRQFATGLPQDARYRIGNVVVKRKPGLGAPREVKRYPPSAVSQQPTISIQLPGFWTQPRRGEGIFVEIDDIYRVNFANQPVKEPFTKRELIQGGFIE